MEAVPQAASAAPKTGALSSMPKFDTGLPVIGVIDFEQPMEWVFWGGLVADLIFVKGPSKWIIAAGILAARYEYGKWS